MTSRTVISADLDALPPHHGVARHEIELPVLRIDEEGVGATSDQAAISQST